jgi:hypothetical protein
MLLKHMSLVLSQHVSALLGHLQATLFYIVSSIKVSPEDGLIG